MTSNQNDNNYNKRMIELEFTNQILRVFILEDFT